MHNMICCHILLCAHFVDYGILMLKFETFCSGLNRHGCNLRHIDPVSVGLVSWEDTWILWKFDVLITFCVIFTPHFILLPVSRVKSA